MDGENALSLMFEFIFWVCKLPFVRSPPIHKPTWQSNIPPCYPKKTDYLPAQDVFSTAILPRVVSKYLETHPACPSLPEAGFLYHLVYIIYLLVVEWGETLIHQWKTEKLWGGAHFGDVCWFLYPTIGYYSISISTINPSSCWSHVSQLFRTSSQGTIL